MKTNAVFYWTSTGLVSIAFFLSSYLYLSRDLSLVNGFKQFGMPPYLIVLLGSMKLLGAIGIINPWFPAVREWSYAGFTFVLVGAVWVHIATGTSFVAPFILLGLLALSYFTNRRYQRKYPLRGLFV